MKKYLFTLLLAFCAPLVYGIETDESLLLINPGRETYINYPSQILKSKFHVTVFLPEKRVPLKKQYPVILWLGAGPKQAPLAEELQARYPAVIVGINWTEADYASPAKLEEFITRELMPYVDTNYFTFADPEKRLLVAEGEQASRLVFSLIRKPNFAYAAAVTALSEPAVYENIPAQVRLYIRGEQAGLAVAQTALETAQKTYGTDFVLHYNRGNSWWETARPDYLWAPKDQVQLKRLEAAVNVKKLVLTENKPARLRVWAVLNNAQFFDYIPVQVRVSPPYLTWDAATGYLLPINGAEKATVRLGAVVDKPGFSAKIKLKKS